MKKAIIIGVSLTAVVTVILLIKKYNKPEAQSSSMITDKKSPALIQKIKDNTVL